MDIVELFLFTMGYCHWKVGGGGQNIYTLSVVFLGNFFRVHHISNFFWGGRGVILGYRIREV